MPSIEIEVKFYIKKYEDIVKKIETYAGLPKSDGFETNILFDFPDKRLSKNGEILRLRKYLGKTIITHKKKIKNPLNDFKRMEETETEVESYNEMVKIFEHMGLEKLQAYEKERTVYTSDRLEICIDRLPFGYFMELEGDEDAIKEMALNLGFDWEKRILPSYRAIFNIIKDKFSLNFEDITFENFADIPINIQEVAGLL